MSESGGMSEGRMLTIKETCLRNNKTEDRIICLECGGREAPAHKGVRG